MEMGLMIMRMILYENEVNDNKNDIVSGDEQYNIII